MKKKILAITLCIAMLAIAIVGGTLAYFTDTDADFNVMTSGNVKIVQNETDREWNAWADNNTAHLVPAVYLKDVDGDGIYETPYNPATTTEGPGGYGPQFNEEGENQWYTGIMNDTDGEGTIEIYDHNINNEVDKMISVTNTGTEPAYVRTVLYVESDPDNAIWNKIHALWCNNDGQYRKWLADENGKDVLLTIGDTQYAVAVCTYNTVLESGATTSPSLMQLFLDPSTDNSWYDLLGADKQLTIVALSQAAQTAGFTSASQALDTAFGEVNKDNVEEWAKGIEFPDDVKTDGGANALEKPAA